MGKQYNKIEKRRRRLNYNKRKKEKAKAARTVTKPKVKKAPARKKEAAAPAAVTTAASAAAAIGDDRYNANLMLAKMGEVNFRLGKTADSKSAYGRMVVKKPEGAAAKAGRRFGGLSATGLADTHTLLVAFK